MSLLDPAVESRIDRVLTQYRESPKLLHLLRTYLSQLVEVRAATAEVPDRFGLETATGGQLTLIGKRLGWPRSHPVCNIVPSFGFECDSDTQDRIAGFCDLISSWEACGNSGLGYVEITDDEMYRKFLMVRAYQVQSRYDLESVETCLKILWGDQAMLLDAGHGRIVVAPGRELTPTEKTLLQLYPRIIPAPLGVEIRFHFESVPVFGFGNGWEGFCEPWHENGLPIGYTGTNGGFVLVTENDELITTGPLTRGGQWMCETDVKPYHC